MFDPVEGLRGRVDLIVVATLRKTRQFVNLIGAPRCVGRQVYEAILDGRRLGMQPHDFVAIWGVFRGAMDPLGDQLLDKLRARAFVLDQDNISPKLLSLLVRCTLQVGVV